MRSTLTSLVLAACLGRRRAPLAPTPAPATAAGTGLKVAIIVGPVGSLTDNYRASGDSVAAAAQAAGATVVKAYSPRATWSRVLDAVRGANIIVYFGHGNGYPNPYSTHRAHRSRQRLGPQPHHHQRRQGRLVDDHGLLRPEGAPRPPQLLGRSGPAQRYCKGGPIRPARGFVMIYGQAHYAPGFGERYRRSDPRTTLKQAQAARAELLLSRSALGASAYFATAYGDATASWRA